MAATRDTGLEGVLAGILGQIQSLSAAVARMGQRAGSAAPSLAATADGVWHDDPAVTVDVLITSGALRVDAAATLTVTGGTLFYGYTLTGPADTQAGLGGTGLAVLAADPGRAVGTTSFVAAGEPAWHTGLVFGWYRLRGAYLLTATAGAPSTSGSYANRLLVAGPQ